jgi:uncharacterized protein (DUF885 family)
MQVGLGHHAPAGGLAGGVFQIMQCASKCRAFAICVAAAAAWGLAGCSTPPAAAPVATQPGVADMSFDTLAGRYLQEMLALTPVAATSLGEHRYDAMLDDVGAEAVARRTALARELLAQLQSIDSGQLTRARQVDAQLLSNELQYEIWRAGVLEDWRWNPLIYTELAGNSVYLLMARDFAPLPERLRNVSARLNALPSLLAQVREVLDPARVPRIHAETAVKQNGGVIELIDQLVVPQLGVLGEADQTQLKGAIARARTAVTQHQLWLEKRLLPAAKGDFRLGAERYDAKLRFALASPLSRQEIRARAEAELARTRREMYGLARSVLAGRADAPPLPEVPTADQQQAAIAAALELAYAQHPSRGEVFESARDSFQRASSFVRAADFITLYDDPLEIVAMPQFQRGVALAYCDSPGPLDRGQKTFYAVSPIPEDWSDAQAGSFLREYNTRSIDDLTIHEAMPGHYVQLMHANRYDSPLRAVLSSGTFIEGWAVYAEQLMVEQGFRGGDPLMRLIQLKWSLRAAANAILDQAVHVDGISREQAMQLLMHDAFQEEREAAGKWVRAQLTSAQLPTYFVGLQEHLALRDEARGRWGRGFALKRYHDTALSFGSPPVRYVRELMFDLPIG